MFFLPMAVAAPQATGAVCLRAGVLPCRFSGPLLSVCLSVQQTVCQTVCPEGSAATNTSGPCPLGLRGQQLCLPSPVGLGVGGVDGT